MERNLATLLGSLEDVAMLRVLSIVHIAITLPMRWHARKTQDLAKYEWGVADMGLCVDLMEKAFMQVAEDGEKLIKEHFIMKCFKPISDRVKPFEDYLTMIFEERTANPMCSVHNDDKKLPYDLLKLYFFYPTRVDIRESHDLSCQLGEVAASRFVV